MEEIQGKKGSLCTGLIHLLTFLNPGLTGSQDCVASSVPLDAAGVRGCIEEILGQAIFCSSFQNVGVTPLPPTLPGSPDTVRGTGPSVEGPQLSEEKGCTALRYGPRVLEQEKMSFSLRL